MPLITTEPQPRRMGERVTCDARGFVLIDRGQYRQHHLHPKLECRTNPALPEGCADAPLLPQQQHAAGAGGWRSPDGRGLLDNPGQVVGTTQAMTCAPLMSPGQVPRLLRRG